MAPLTGKVALITRAARGQGRAHAVRLAEAGADIMAFEACARFDSVDYDPSTTADLEETAHLVETAGQRRMAGRPRHAYSLTRHCWCTPFLGIE